MMTGQAGLREAILERLKQVIDPATGADVIHMRLVEDLSVDDGGVVRYGFRPSSPLCPIAIPLALSIREAVGEVEGVTRQEIEVRGYIGAEALNEILRELEGET